jgi:ATP-dependent Clp protease protease subunit
MQTKLMFPTADRRHLMFGSTEIRQRLGCASGLSSLTPEEPPGVGVHMDPLIVNELLRAGSQTGGMQSSLQHMVPPRVNAQAASYQARREMTLDDLLLENRVIFLVGDIHAGSSARIMMQMLYLEDQKRGQTINLYINSGGGVVDDTLAIYDTMRFISSEVHTTCIGRAYSGAAVLMAAGEPGKRGILPHAKIMIHQPYGGVTGQATDVKIQAEEIIQSKQTLNEILAEHTGQTYERIASDSERDKFFRAEEAKAYGLVDEVFEFPAKGK